MQMLPSSSDKHLEIGLLQEDPSLSWPVGFVHLKALTTIVIIRL